MKRRDGETDDEFKNRWESDDCCIPGGHVDPWTA